MSEDTKALVWLNSGEPFGVNDPVKRIDTHAAHIFLAGDRAWKIKRPVRLGYLDFSTAQKRRDVLREELRLNRRTAPDLYSGVHAITREDDRLVLDGTGEAVDWILEMRRFPDDALLDRRAREGALDETMLRRLADVVVDFHARAEIGPRKGGADRMRRVIEGNAASMAAVSAVIDASLALELCRRQTDLVGQYADLLDARARASRVRRVHGDLHLGNVAIIEDVPTPFDCLEFDAELATIDVLYDLAFLLMDLWARGLRRAANIVFNRYVDQSAVDEDAIVLLPLFMSIRATIRAHVLATNLTGNPDAVDQAHSYLALARRLIEPAPAQLIAIGGLSGTGKSTLARAIGGLLGRPPGARILRSDILRKRRAGVPMETPLGADAYRAQESQIVYAELDRLAGNALVAGQCVVADAVFGSPEERASIEQVATTADAPFMALWLVLPEADRIRRIAGRGPDASDATAGVARLQSGTVVPPGTAWAHLSVAGSLKDLEGAAMKQLSVPDPELVAGPETG